MHLDVIRLRAFYYRTKLGRIVQRALREEIVRLWPDVKGQTVAGFGFAAPMLRPFLKNALITYWRHSIGFHLILVHRQQVLMLM